MQPAPFGLVLGQRQHGGDGFPSRQRQQIVERPPLGLRAADRELPDLMTIYLAGAGKEQDRVVGTRYEKVGDDVLVLGRHARATLATAPLGTIFGQRDTLDPARMRDGDNHILALDKVFIVKIIAANDDFAAPLGAELVADSFDLGAQHGIKLGAIAQNVEQACDGSRKFLKLIADFLASECR